jgi:hypothetical protein
MMKKLLSLLLVVPLLTSAQSSSGPITIEKTVVCDKTQNVLDVIINGRYQENPVWGGVDDDSRYGLLVNRETGTWTIIQFNKETACVLGTGKSSRSMYPGKGV